MASVHRLHQPRHVGSAAQHGCGVQATNKRRAARRLRPRTASGLLGAAAVSIVRVASCVKRTIGGGRRLLNFIVLRLVELSHKRAHGAHTAHPAHRNPENSSGRHEARTPNARHSAEAPQHTLPQPHSILTVIHITALFRGPPALSRESRQRHLRSPVSFRRARP